VISLRDFILTGQICEGNVIDGSIDITTNAAALNNSLALIRAQIATGNTTNLYSELEAAQKHHVCIRMRVFVSSCFASFSFFFLPFDGLFVSICLFFFFLFNIRMLVDC
jgi:hypothetical protein